MNRDGQKNYNCRDRYRGPSFTPRPYQTNFFGDPGGFLYDPLNFIQGAQPLNCRVENPMPFCSPPTAASKLYAASDLQSRVSNTRNSQQQERDPSFFYKKRKFEGGCNQEPRKQSSANNNQRDASTKPISKETFNKNDAVSSRKHDNIDSTKLADIPRSIVEEQRPSNNDIEIITLDDEQDELLDKEDRRVDVVPKIVTSVSNIQPLPELSIKIPRIDAKIVCQKSTAEASTDKSSQSNKQSTEDSLIQLKLFLLECNRKLRDNFNVYYISDVRSAREVTDAVLSIEKADSRYFYQVKYFHPEYRSYKKISYRTLVSSDFNLDMIYKVYKDNEDIERIIICSNLELDEQSLKKRNIKVIDCKSRYTRHLQVSEESELFKRMIEKHSIIPRLAEYMDECMRTGKPVVMKGPIKECHVMLIAENVVSITAAAGRRKIGKLHPRFVNSPDSMLKPAIAQLRRHLKSLNFGKLRINEKLIVGENFGKDSSFQRSQVDKFVQDLGIEVTLRKFFERLEFIECDKNIECYVVKELGPKFALMQSDDHVRAVKEELFRRLRRGAGQTGLFRALESKILGCYLKNYEQKKNDSGIKLEFESKRLESIKFVLMENKKSTILIKSDSPALCALKVQQAVKSLSRYSEGRYFFLHIDDLLSAKNDLLNVFRTPVEHLLVVQAENTAFKSEEVKDCLIYIRGSISNDLRRTNKIAIIQSVNDPPFDFYADVIEHKEIFNNDAGFTQDFQETLSKTLCECYGADDTRRTIALKELILQPRDLFDLLSSVQCVDKLVKEKIVIGGNLVRPLAFESSYTVPRYLKRHVVISSIALKEGSQDKFFIYGEEKESKINRIRYFKDFNFALSSFQDFASQNTKINAHLLKCVTVGDSSQLLWQRSTRTTSTLTKYVVESSEGAGHSEPTADVLVCRFIIICDKPGSGKSHYLFELARKVQSSSDNLENWVVQLNLRDSMLEQHALCPLNRPVEAVDLIAKMLGYDELHRRLLHLSISGKLKMKLSLFVDGLENLRECNVHRWFQILRLLRDTDISRIYVTARPILKKAMEQTLGDFAYNLDSLKQDQQRIFLVKIWSSLANQGAIQYNWHDYVDEIFNAKKLSSVISEPLYLHIFAYVFWYYMKDGQKLPLMHRVCHLYTEYLDKFANHLPTRARKDIFVKSFPYLALKNLLHPSDFRKLNLPEVLLSEDFSKLNHSSFSEYGAAKWLASLPLQQQLRAFNIIEDLADRTSIVFSETFFINNCNEFYLEYIEHAGDNRLVIHLLLQHIWSVADDAQRQEYMKEAVRANRIKLVCELMLKRAVEIELPTDFLERVTVHVIWTLADQKSNTQHPYWSLVETLVQQAPRAIARIDAEVQLPRVLAHFFARGRHELVAKVLNSLEDHKKEQSILHSRVDGLTPLEIVNSSGLMTDDQRLAISRFLVERVDSKKNVHCVMTAAARHGHVHCLEYFAGRSTEIRNNFLTNAIKTNQLDVLRFLLNDTQWTRDYSQAKNYPLHTAMSEKASLKTLDFLLRYGGINNRNGNGETALAVAIKAGVDLRIIKLLVEKEADVNVKDKMGLRPWCYAVLQKWSRYYPDQQLELMRFLKRGNRSPKLPHPEDFQLTYWCRELERKLECLWDPERFDRDWHEGRSRLHGALRDKDLVWFKFLLQHGADPDILDTQGSTALHLAVTLEDSQDVLVTVRLLLRYGATFDRLDSNGKAPYDLLCSNKNAADKKDEACGLLRLARDLFTDCKCLDQLKKETAVKDSSSAQSTMLYWLIHCRDARGRTLLHRAIERNLPVEDLNKLLQFTERYGNRDLRGSSWLDARDVNGDTVVHAAARQDSHGMVRELARRGALLTATNARGETPRDLITDLEAKEFLKTGAELFASVRSGCLGELQTVARRQCDYLVKTRDEAGCTLLHLAAAGRGSLVGILLLRWKANVNATDGQRRAPLHHALLADDLQSARLLVKYGASMDPRDKAGKRPIDLGNPEHKSVRLICQLSELLERCWRGKLGAAELRATLHALNERYGLKPNAAVNARDATRNSMVHYAARNHEPELLRELLRRGAMYNTYNAAKEMPADLANGEIKELLTTVDEFFKRPGVATWEAKMKDVELDVVINCRKIGGYTLLHTVLEDKKIEEAKWLLDRGADVYVKNHVGVSARKLAENLHLIDV